MTYTFEVGHGLIAFCWASSGQWNTQNVHPTITYMFLLDSRLFYQYTKGKTYFHLNILFDIVFQYYCMVLGWTYM